MTTNKSKPLTDEVLLHTYDVYIHTGGSIRATAKKLNLRRNATRNRLQKVKERLGLEWDRPVVSGSIQGLQKEIRKLPPKGKVKRYLLTCAQNNTRVHPQFWNNLKAYATYHNAELLVSQFAYNKASYSGSTNVKPGQGPSVEDFDSMWFDSALEGYFCNARVELSPHLMFCGEVTIMPTAARPLSGFETYTRKADGIFPHTTFALESIPGHMAGDTKMNYTTGTVTIKNYIIRKAGLKAEFHHVYGALIVEIDCEGSHWVRQINATGEGSFYDLDAFVEDGEVTVKHRVEAINWGDIHVDSIDEAVAVLSFDSDGILDTLKPRYQFMHDTLDFHSRNHHRIKNPHAMFERWIQNRECVRSEMERAVDFLNETSYRDWCKTVVVPSNHDDALERWLREANPKTDPVNAIFYHETELKKLYAIQAQHEHYYLLEDVLQSLGANKNIKFLHEDTSFLLCNNIEAGMHGHLGPNGARAGILSFARMGRRTNTGHSHSTGICWGAYVAGTMSQLRLEYNKGPSSWSHSDIITYPNSKRCILSIRNNKWRG